MKKICKKCNIEKSLTEYYKNKKIKDGHDNRCKSCEKIRRRKQYLDTKEHTLKKNKEWKEKNKERTKQIARDYYVENKDEINKKHRQHYRENKEQYTIRVMEYRKNNPEYYDKQKEYRKNNPEKTRYYSAKYRAKKLNATIGEYSLELEKIYYNCPEDHEVDHIVPLQGNNVSGLHVPWNLQYLTVFENRSKGNKHEDD